MRTSLNEIQQIEAYLQGRLQPAEALLFRAKLLLDPALRLNLRGQKQAYLLLKRYHRHKLKKELSAVHEQLFNDPQKTAFQQEILHLFKPQQP